MALRAGQLDLSPSMAEKAIQGWTASLHHFSGRLRYKLRGTLAFSSPIQLFGNIWHKQGGSVPQKRRVLMKLTSVVPITCPTVGR